MNTINLVRTIVSGCNVDVSIVKGLSIDEAVRRYNSICDGYWHNGYLAVRVLLPSESDMERYSIYQKDGSMVTVGMAYDNHVSVTEGVE